MFYYKIYTFYWTESWNESSSILGKTVTVMFNLCKLLHLTCYWIVNQNKAQIQFQFRIIETTVLTSYSIDTYITLPLQTIVYNRYWTLYCLPRTTIASHVSVIVCTLYNETNLTQRDWTIPLQSVGHANRHNVLMVFYHYKSNIHLWLNFEYIFTIIVQTRCTIL